MTTAPPTKLIIDGILKAKLPIDKHSIIKNDWRERYCAVEERNGKVTMLIYKSKKMGKRQTSTVHCALPLTMNASVQIEDHSTRFIFHVLQDNHFYSFSTLTSSNRQIWTNALRQCIDKQKTKSPSRSPSQENSNKMTNEKDINVESREIGAVKISGENSDGVVRLERKGSHESPTSTPRAISKSKSETIEPWSVGGNIEPPRLQKHLGGTPSVAHATLMAPSASTAPKSAPERGIHKTRSSSSNSYSSPPGALDTPALIGAPLSFQERAMALAAKQEDAQTKDGKDIPARHPFWKREDVDTLQSKSTDKAALSAHANGIPTSESASSKSPVIPTSPLVLSRADPLFGGSRESDRDHRGQTFQRSVFNKSAGNLRPDETTGYEQTDDSCGMGGDTRELEMKSLMHLNGELNDSIEDLTAELSELRRAHEMSTIKFEQKLSELNAQNSELEKENQLLREDNRRKDVANKELQLVVEENNRIAATGRSDTEALDKYKNLTESLTRDNQQLNVEIDALRRQVSAIEETEKKSSSSIKLLLENIEKTEREKMNLTKQLCIATEETERLCKEREEMVTQVSELSEKCRVSERELQELQRRVHSEVLEEVAQEARRVCALEDECLRLENQLVETVNASKRWEVEVIRLQTELDDKIGSLEQMKSCNDQTLIQDMKSDIELKTRKLEDKDAEIASLQSQLKSRKRECEKEKARNAELLGRFEKVKEEHTESDKAAQKRYSALEDKLRKQQAELMHTSTELKDSERRCILHKERLAKIEEEMMLEHDSRTAERKGHARALRELQASVESAVDTTRDLQEKLSALENENSMLKGERTKDSRVISSLKSQLENVENMFQNESRALKSEKGTVRQLQDTVEMLKMDQERDRLQYEEKLRRVNAARGESKQILLETETKITELSSELQHDKSTNAELARNLRLAEDRCKEITSEVQRIKDVRKCEKKEAERRLVEMQTSLNAATDRVSSLEKELCQKNKDIDDMSLDLKKKQIDIEALGQWKDECRSLQERLTDKEERLEDCMRSLSSLEKRNASLVRDLQTTEELMTRYQDKNTELQEALNAAEISNHKNEKTIKDAMKTKKHLEKEISDLNVSYKECDSRLSRKCEELNNVLQELKLAKCEISSKTEELESAKADIAALKKDYRVMEEALKKSENTVQTLTSSNSALQEELVSANERAVGFEKLLESQQSELLSTKSDLNAALQRSEEISANLSYVKEAHDLALSDIESLESQLHSAEKSENELQSSKSELSALRRAYDECCSELSDLKGANESLKNEICAKSGQLESVTQSLRELETVYTEKRSELEASCALMTAEAKKYEQSYRDTESTLRLTKSSLEDQISGLYAKITKAMSDCRVADRVIRSCLHQLCESHVWSLSDVAHCGVHLTDAEKESPDATGETKSSDPAALLEKCVAHVCSDSTQVHNVYNSLHDVCIELQKGVTTSYRHLCAHVCDVSKDILDQHLLYKPTPFLEFEDGDFSGLSKIVSFLSKLNEYSRANDSVRDKLISVLQHSLTDQEEIHRAEVATLLSSEQQARQQEIAEMERTHRAKLATTNELLSSALEEVSRLSNEVQKVEMSVCKAVREKEDIEVLLRRKMTPQEYHSAFHCKALGCHTSECDDCSVGNSSVGEYFCGAGEMESKMKSDGSETVSSGSVCGKTGVTSSRIEECDEEFDISSIHITGLQDDAMDQEIVDKNQTFSGFSTVSSSAPKSFTTASSRDRHTKIEKQHSQHSSRRSRGACVPLSNRGSFSCTIPASIGRLSSGTPSVNKLRDTRVDSILTEKDE